MPAGASQTDSLVSGLKKYSLFFDLLNLMTHGSGSPVLVMAIYFLGDLSTGTLTGLSRWLLASLEPLVVGEGR